MRKIGFIISLCVHALCLYALKPITRIVATPVISFVQLECSAQPQPKGPTAQISPKKAKTSENALSKVSQKTLDTHEARQEGITPYLSNEHPSYPQNGCGSCRIFLLCKITPDGIVAESQFTSFEKLSPECIDHAPFLYAAMQAVKNWRFHCICQAPIYVTQSFRFSTFQDIRLP